MEYKKATTAQKNILCAGAVIMMAILAQGIAMGEVLKATYDFGYLVEGDPAEVMVEIENTSSEPVEITNVRTS